MRKEKSMSLDEHIATANDLAVATHYLSKVFLDVKNTIRNQVS